VFSCCLRAADGRRSDRRADVRSLGWRESLSDKTRRPSRPYSARSSPRSWVTEQARETQHTENAKIKIDLGLIKKDIDSKVSVQRPFRGAGSKAVAGDFPNWSGRPQNANEARLRRVAPRAVT